MKDNITQRIWKSTENIALIYVGSAAEFALVEENHWLFFTNMLPSNPQLRFIETFKYNQMMILADKSKYTEITSRIRKIHENVELRRGKAEGGHPEISNDAYKLVGYMLVDYGIKGYEYLHRKEMSLIDKNTYYQDMRYIFSQMHIKNLPENYSEFLNDRKKYLSKLKINSNTERLYSSYKKDMGILRYWILKQFQSYFIPNQISKMLNLRKNLIFALPYKLYPYIRSSMTRDLLEIIMLRKDVLRVLDIMEEKTGYIE